MAAQAVKWYNQALKKIGLNEINLLSDTFRAILVTSASNFATATLGLLGSLTGEVTEANGYSSSGKALSTVAWTVGASAMQYKFDADDLSWSANGGTISNIKGIVIAKIGASAGARHLVGYASLTSSQFALAAGNRINVNWNSGGILTLSRT